MGDIHTSSTSKYITNNPFKRLSLLSCFANSSKLGYMTNPTYSYELIRDEATNTLVLSDQ